MRIGTEGACPELLVPIMRVSAGEELDQCARETHIIEDTYCAILRNTSVGDKVKTVQVWVKHLLKMLSPNRLALELNRHAAPNSFNLIFLRKVLADDIF